MPLRVIPSACCTTIQWKSCRCTTRSASVAGMCTLLSQHESVGKAASVHVQALEPSRVLCKSLLRPESWPSPGTALTADWRPSRHSPKPHGLPAPSTFAFLPVCFFFHADHAISCPWNIIYAALSYSRPAAQAARSPTYASMTAVTAASGATLARTTSLSCGCVARTARHSSSMAARRPHTPIVCSSCVC